MYKALFCLCVAAVVADDVIDCASGTIDPADVLSITGAPQSATECSTNCAGVCPVGSIVSDCLSAGDTLAGCAFDLADAQIDIPAGSCETGPTGQWVVPQQDWSTMTKVTISFKDHETIQSITVGVKGTNDCVTDEASPPAACTAGECDITDWIKSQLTGELTIVATDVSTPATDLNLAAATVTSKGATPTKVYGESSTCKNQNSESDCGNAGCNWCYDTETFGCGPNPSVCVEDGTSSTTPASTTTTASTASTSASTTTTTTSAGADGSASVFMAVMTSALLFKFM